MSQLTTNTTTIDECIALANSLPDAESGSGGATVGTCTVTLDGAMSAYLPICCSYTSLDDNGNITSNAVDYENPRSATLENVVCGSVVTIYWNKIMMGAPAIVTNAERIVSMGTQFNAYRITAPANGYASIINDNTDSGPA